MTVRRKGRQWQADFMVDGKRFRRSFDTETEAEAWEHQARAALQLGQPIPDGSPKSLGGRDAGTLGGLLRDCETLHWKLAGKGLGKQAELARVFVRFVGERVPVREAFAQETIDRFVRHLIEERKLSDGSLNRYRSAVFVLAKRAGVPLPTWKRVREGKGRLRFLSEDEEALILQTLKLWGLHREHDFVVFLVDTGARPFSEAAQVEWSDIISKSVMLYGREGNGTKNGESRAVPLTTRALEAARRWKHLGEKGPWSSLTKDHMRRVWDRLRAHLPQIADTVLYTCRHTCASRLVQRGVDLRRVQLWMGHKNIQITLRYALLAPDHLLDAVAVLETGGARLRVVAGSTGAEE